MIIFLLESYFFIQHAFVVYVNATSRRETNLSMLKKKNLESQYSESKNKAVAESILYQPMYIFLRPKKCNSKGIAL